MPQDVSADMDWDDVVDDQGLPSERTVGRPSNDVKQLLDDAYAFVIKKAKETAALTGLSPAQVLEYMLKERTRSHVKENFWNLYGSYLAQHMDEELSYLPQGALFKFANLFGGLTPARCVQISLTVCSIHVDMLLVTVGLTNAHSA